ncbi:MAG: NUDIX hydrolase [Aggregatilineales bacterium]
MQEDVIARKRVFDGKLVKLDHLTVRLPNGGQSEREIVEHPGAAAVVALDAHDRVLLVHQYRLAARRVLREIPAGTLEPGEDPLECAKRELQEETGYLPGRLEHIGGLYVAPGYTTEYIHLFLALDLTYAPLAADDDEFIEVEQLPLGEALALIDSGDIVDGKSIAGLLRVARLRGLRSL